MSYNYQFIYLLLIIICLFTLFSFLSSSFPHSLTMFFHWAVLALLLLLPRAVNGVERVGGKR